MISAEEGFSVKKLFGALVFIILLGCFFYLPKVSDNIGWYNSGEFVAASISLDVPHAPGYPLLTRLGNAFLHIPMSAGPAMKLNLLSTLIGLFSVTLMLIFLRLAGVSAFPALAGCIFLLSSRTYFEQAISIEVYCLEIAFIIMGLIVGIFLARGSNSPFTAFAAGFVGTIGVGHRPTFILYAITLIFFINHRRNDLKGLSPFWFLAGIFFGAIPSIDLFFRLQSVNRVLLDPLVGQGISGFLQVFTGTVYSGGLFSLRLNELFARFLYFFRFILKDAPIFLLPGAMFALGYSKEESPVKKALVFIGAINLIFVLNYNAFEAHSMLLPCIFSLCAMCSFALNKIRPEKIRFFVCLLVAIIAILAAYPNQKALTKEPVNYCQRMLSQVPANSVLLMSNDVEFRPYYYLRLTQNMRPDIGIQLVDNIEAPELKGLSTLIRKRNVAGTFVYPPDAIEKLVASFSVVPQGYGFRIVDPEFPSREFQSFAPGEKIKFNRAEILLPEKKTLNLSAMQGEPFKYSFAFSGPVNELRKLKVWAYLVDLNGKQIFRNGLLVAHDCHAPVNLICREKTMNEGKLDLKLQRTLIIPPDLAPGKYTFKLFFEESDSGLNEVGLPEVENVNLFNKDGFLEVFKLNYGLCGRFLIDRGRAISFKPGTATFFSAANGPDVMTLEIKKAD